MKAFLLTLLLLGSSVVANATDVVISAQTVTLRCCQDFYDLPQLTEAPPRQPVRGVVVANLGQRGE
jgi:hypothetical protein